MQPTATVCALMVEQVGRYSGGSQIALLPLQLIHSTCILRSRRRLKSLGGWGGGIDSGERKDGYNYLPWESVVSRDLIRT